MLLDSVDFLIHPVALPVVGFALVVMVAALTPLIDERIEADSGLRERGDFAPGEPTMSPQERIERFQPGPPWDGRGTGSMTQGDMEAFADYPIFWLGDSFAGYNFQ